ncbi:hypothetical protein BSF_07820 [Bacillus subtilis]|nr:hypothetical protein BSF_07820 [Bacillus subtilis]
MQDAAIKSGTFSVMDTHEFAIMFFVRIWNKFSQNRKWGFRLHEKSDVSHGFVIRLDSGWGERSGFGPSDVRVK